MPQLSIYSMYIYVQYLCTELGSTSAQLRVFRVSNPKEEKGTHHGGKVLIDLAVHEYLLPSEMLSCIVT